MNELLYVSSSQFSGTTLLSFLLNLHPQITTTGHTTCWNFGAAKEINLYCSCGQLLNECPYYKKVKQAFEKENLAFDFRHFGTDYRLSRHERLNRHMMCILPWIRVSALERSRDCLLRHMPGLSEQLRGIDKANVIFVDTAFDHHHA